MLFDLSVYDVFAVLGEIAYAHCPTPAHRRIS
jgi:hypothetical protein